MKKWIKQISEWEIYEIRILLKEWNSIPQTALKVWRNKTTIYRLLNNNNIKYNEIKYRSVWWKWGVNWNNWDYLRVEWKRKYSLTLELYFYNVKNEKVSLQGDTAE